tara:strand:- start:135 stop:317 length:183 start_codon:yes stop_codon:yes gene_type:complete
LCANKKLEIYENIIRKKIPSNPASPIFRTETSLKTIFLKNFPYPTDENINSKTNKKIDII